MEKTVNWKVGSGTITLSYSGSGTGTISVTCSENTGGGRTQEVTIKTQKPDSPILTKTLRIYQEGTGSYDGGISVTTSFKRGLNCSVSDSTYTQGTDTLCDCGGA